jgi:uncharacterized protein
MTAGFDLHTDDGVQLAARRVTPTGTARATVVLVHGFAASSTEPRVVAVADALAATGAEVLTYDARGHGASDGLATLGDLERLDVGAAVDAAQHDPVVVVGASVGAIAVLRYVSGAPGSVAGVVTLSCPARWRLPRNARGLASALMTQTRPGRWAARRYVGVRIAPKIERPAPPIELVAGLAAPLAIVHGRADPFIPPTDAEALDAAAGDPHRLELVDGLGHAYEPEAIPAILAGVDWVLDPGRA